jgi:hypothetical protein
MPAINGRSGLIHLLRAVTAATVMARCTTLLPAVSAWQPATKAGIVLSLDEERFTAAAPSAAQAPQPPKPEARDDGMGQGRNSLHLARLGWDVTGGRGWRGPARLRRQRAAHDVRGAAGPALRGHAGPGRLGRRGDPVPVVRFVGEKR